MLGFHHDLPASRTGEVSRLIASGYLEFGNALNWCRNCSHSAYAVVDVVVIALQIAGYIAAIKHVSILIAQGPRYLPSVDVPPANSGSCGRLQGEDRSRVAIQVRQGKKHLAGHR